jgi:hypothetical protein
MDDLCFKQYVQAQGLVHPQRRHCWRSPEDGGEDEDEDEGSEAPYAFLTMNKYCFAKAAQRGHL